MEESNLLDGPDYRTEEWWDETSQFDQGPNVRWNGGTECYERLYRCRVPSYLIDREAIDNWIEDNLEQVKWLD